MGSLLEVNPEKEGCIPETETGEISVDAEMASEVLGTPGDKTVLESQGISGTDKDTETMQILEAEGIKKVLDMDEVMQIDESLTIPELEQVSMVRIRQGEASVLYSSSSTSDLALEVLLNQETTCHSRPVA